MANIQPFRAIRSNPFYADQLVFTSLQVESVSGDETRDGMLAPLKHLLETGARLRPETPEGQAKAFQEIKDTLKALLESDKLWHEQTPGIYVYEVEHKTYRQTGVWALTSLNDYKQGNIKIHELTFGDSIRRLTNYRRNTGLEGSPVLLAYHPDITINRIIAETIKHSKKITYGNEHGLHHLWKIEDIAVQQHLINAFEKIKTVYLADGHHRLESSALLAAEQRAKGLIEFGQISSLYMATDQLRIEEYNRVVIPQETIDKDAFFNKIKQHFEIHASNQGVQPRKPHHFGMRFENNWFELTANPELYNKQNAAADLDAYTLQETILAPIFGIKDPKTDQRLKCAGGEMAMDEINAILAIHPEAIVFTLCPVSVEQLIEVAEAGEILPPKSTWIVPKIPYALLLHRHPTE